jgi:EmrB/QacA subfamily drug resistance transporter
VVEDEDKGASKHSPQEMAEISNRSGSSDSTIDIERDGAPSRPEKSLHYGDKGEELSLPRNPEAEAPAPTTEGTAQQAGTDATGPSPDEPEAGRTKLETFLIVFALCLALFLAALDITIISTAIPTISAYFNSSEGYVWVGSAYVLGNAAFVPTWGKISDVFGRKPVLLLSIAIFWVGSLLCGVANSMGMLIAARAIQGVGGGGTIALPNICISDLFSVRNRSMYFGILGMVWALASAIGPIMGGVFTSRVSWRWCFYINLPISGVGMIILFFVLKLHNPRTPIKEGLAAIDWTGSLLIIGGTLMFLMGLEFGGVKFPWDSPTVLCLIIFGFVTIGLFILYEGKVAKYPLTPLRLFLHRNSVVSYGLAFMHGFTFMGGSYWLPLYFQGILRASPLMSGVYLLPFVLSLSFVSALVGIVIKRTGNYKIPISGGLFITVLGFGLFIDLGSTANWAKIIVFQIIAGIGIGPNFQAPLIALQNNIEPRDIGSATSSFAFLRQMGTSVSVVVGGVIFNNEMGRQQGLLLRELGPELAGQLSGANAAGNVNRIASLTGEDGDIARGAYWRAMRTMFIVYTCFGAMGFIISLFMKQVKLKKDHKEHKTGLKSLAGRQLDSGKQGQGHDDSESPTSDRPAGGVVGSEEK